MSVIDQIMAEIIKQKAFNDVSAALDFNAIDSQGQLQSGAAAWVLELLTDADQNSRDIGFPVQMEKQLFAVVIGIKSVNDKNGERVLGELITKRRAVRKALFGFIPEHGNHSYEPLTLAGSKIISLQSGAVFWAERFQTQHLIDQENLL